MTAAAPPLESFAFPKSSCAVDRWNSRQHWRYVVHLSNVAAVELVDVRIPYSTTAYAELALWQLPRPVAGSTHRFKYRLAYVVRGVCVLRYDNTAGKGDHTHFGRSERPYVVSTPERVVEEFRRDIGRWNRENRDT